MSEDLKQLFEAARAAASMENADPRETGGIPYAVIPPGHTLASLESLIHNDYAQFPHRKKLDVTVIEPASFLEYWSLHQTEDSRAYGNCGNASIEGVLDDHGSTEKQPGWRQHRVTLGLVLSDEWKVWNGNNKKPLDQATFAEFLEDNAPDIIQPDAATFVECARDLKAKSDVTFESRVSQSNGSARLTWNENVAGKFGKGDIEIPERFVISIAVYVGTPKISIDARLRYRIVSGKLTMWYDLYRIGQRQRDAFQSVVAEIEAGIGRKVLICG